MSSYLLHEERGIPERKKSGNMRGQGQGQGQVQGSCGRRFLDVLKIHAIDIILTIGIWAVMGCIHFLIPSKENFFLERDPTLSYPWRHGAEESVPDWLLFVLGIPLAMLLIFIVQALFTWCITKHDIPERALNFFVPQLAFVEAMGTTLLLTEFLKAFAGRKRPNFFAYCNYQGYRDALASNPPNLTDYFARTTAGAIGNLSNCFDPSHLKDAQSSFPSGHSSVIFCGFGFVGLFILYLLNRYSNRHNMGKTLIALVMYFTAAIVAATRLRDNWHNYDDVLAGSSIGFACSVFAFVLNFSDLASAAEKVEDTLLPDS